MSIARTIKRSIAMILSMLMIVTSVDMTALLQVHAETLAGNVTFTDLSEEAGHGEAFYIMGSTEPNVEVSSGSPVPINGATQFRIKLSPSQGYSLDSNAGVRLYIGDEDTTGTVLEPDGPYYSYVFGDNDETPSETKYEVKYAFVENNGGNGGNNNGGSNNSTPGHLIFDDRSDDDHSGIVYCFVDDNNSAITSHTTRDNDTKDFSLINEETPIFSSTLKFSFAPADENSTLDTHRGVTLHVNGVALTATGEDDDANDGFAYDETEHEYIYTKGNESIAESTYVLEYGFEGNGGGGQHQGGGNGTVTFANFTQIEGEGQEAVFKYSGSFTYKFDTDENYVEAITANMENNNKVVNIPEGATKLYVKINPTNGNSLGQFKQDDENNNIHLDCPYTILRVNGLPYLLNYVDKDENNNEVNAYVLNLTKVPGENGAALNVSETQYRIEYAFAGPKAEITVSSDESEHNTEKIVNPTVREPGWITHKEDENGNVIQGDDFNPELLDVLDWSYSESWKYTKFAVNYDSVTSDKDDGTAQSYFADFEHGQYDYDQDNKSATKIVNYDPKENNKVDLVVYMSWSMRPREVITVNGQQYFMKNSEAATENNASGAQLFPDFNNEIEWLEMCSCGYRDQSLRFTLEGIPTDGYIQPDGSLRIEVNIDVRTISDDECFVGNFLWSNNEVFAGQGKYIGDSELSLISVQYPDNVIAGLLNKDIDALTDADRAAYIYQANVLETQMMNKKNEKDARYVNYAKDNYKKESNGNLVLDDHGDPIPVEGLEDGEMLLPEGSLVTMSIIPHKDYQVTSFGINGEDVAPDKDVVGQYTFTIGKGNFHLGATVEELGDTVDAELSGSIKEGSIVLADADEATITQGTAELTIEGVPVEGDEEAQDNDKALTAAQKEGFENVANGLAIQEFVDINLNKTVYKGIRDEEGRMQSWDTPMELTQNATISLKLDKPASSVTILHEVTVEKNGVQTKEYVKVPIKNYDAANSTVTFETDSFSPFAIATVADVKSFKLDSETQTLYLSPNTDNSYEYDWTVEPVIDEQGHEVKDGEGNTIYNGFGTSSTFLLTYKAYSDAAESEESQILLNDILWQTSDINTVDVFPQYDENGRMIGANVHALKTTGRSPVTITATVPGTNFKATCKVTVANGTIDIITEGPKWGPKLDEEGHTIIENGKEVWEELKDEHGNPIIEKKIRNSFGNIAQAKVWAQDAWDNQRLDDLDHWKEDNPSGNDDTFNKLWMRSDPDADYSDFYFGPTPYIVKTYADQAITATGNNSVDALHYTYNNVSFDEFVAFDLNGKNFTVNAPLYLNQGITYTDSSADKKGTLIANKGIEVEQFSEITLDSNVTTTTFTVGEGSWVYSSGNFKATGLSTFNAYSTIIDNKNMTFAAVNIKTDLVPDEYNPEVEVQRDGDVNFARFIGEKNGEGEIVLPEATLTFNGVITSDDCTRLRIGRIPSQAHRGDPVSVDNICEETPVDPLDPQGEKIITVKQRGLLEDINPSSASTDAEKKSLTKLCNTNQKSLPTFVQAWLPWGGTSGYYVAYLEGGMVYAGMANYYLNNKSFNIHIGDFTNWIDAANAVAAINDPNCEFELGINAYENNVLGNFKTPKAAYSMTFRSNLEKQVQAKDPQTGEFLWEDEEKTKPIIVTEPDIVVLNYTGNTLNINTDTYFENVHFVKVDGNNDPTDPYSVTTFNMAGHDLTARGQVEFNTPVNFNDAKKTGTLRLEYGSNLWTGYTDTSKYIGNTAISDWINKKLPWADSYMIIAGSVSNVGTVIVEDDQMLIVSDYITVSKNNKGVITGYTFNAPVFTPVNLRTKGTVWITTKNSKEIAKASATDVVPQAAIDKANSFKTLGKANITNTFMDGRGRLQGDAIQLTNVYLNGDGWIESDYDFNITGTLTSCTDRGVLMSTRNERNNLPYLNVSGAVVLQDSNCKVQVGIFDRDFNHENVTAAHPSYYATLTGDETNTSVLLQTKNGTMDQFVPYFAAYEDSQSHEWVVDTSLPAKTYATLAQDGSIESYKIFKDEENHDRNFDHISQCEFNSGNRDGYFFKKANNCIYVLTGEQAAVAVAVLNESDPGYFNDENGDALQNAGQNIIGYYPTWADAVAGVNTLKTKQRYEFIITRNIGGDTSANKPVTMTFPTAANISELTVTSISTDDPTNDSWYDIYFTNGLTLSSHTRFVDIGLTPVKSTTHNKVTVNSAKTNLSGYSGTSLAINASAYNLIMENVIFGTSGFNSFGNAAEYQDSWNMKSGIGTITGNNKNSISIHNSKDIRIGAISKVDSVLIHTNGSDTEAVVNGSIQANDLKLIADGSSEIIVNGKVTVKTLEDSGDMITLGSDVSASTQAIFGAETAVNGALSTASLEANCDILRVIGKMTVTDVKLHGDDNAGGSGKINARNTVDIKGTLFMDGNDVLDTSENAGAAVTIKNIDITITEKDEYDNDIEVSSANNKIKFARSKNAKIANGISNFKITGMINNPVKYDIISDRLIYNNKLLIDCVTGTETAGLIAAELTANPSKNNQVTPGAGNLIATIGTNPEEMITYTQNGVELDPNYAVVKYNGGLYYADKTKTPFNNSIVAMKQVNSPVSDYLDWNEAIKEINNINEITCCYELITLPYTTESDELTDTVITDDKMYGGFVLPSANKSSEIVVKASSGHQVVAVDYTGNISGYARVRLANVQLSPRTAANNATVGSTKIAISRNTAKNAESSCQFSVDYDTKKDLLFTVDGKTGTLTGFSGGILNLYYVNASISGDMTATVPENRQMNVVNSSLTVNGKATVNGVGQTVLTDSDMIFGGVTTIYDLSLNTSDVTFNSTATLTNLTTDNTADACTSVITATHGTVNKVAGRSLLTVKGNINGFVYTKLIVPVTTKVGNKTVTEYKALEETGADPAVKDYTLYEDKFLICAPALNNASLIRAYGLYVNPESGAVSAADNIVAYKDNASYVANINKNNMLWTVSEDGGALVSYAKTWNDAVAVINNINDKDKSYTIELQKAGIWRADALAKQKYDSNGKSVYASAGSYTGTEDTVNGTTASYGTADVAALTMPKATAANKITVKKAAGLTDKATLIYKGGLTANTNLDVVDIGFTTTKKDTAADSANKNKYIPADTTAVTIVKDATVTFGSGAVNSQLKKNKSDDPNNPVYDVYDRLTLSSVTGAGNKQVGTLVINPFTMITGGVTLSDFVVNDSGASYGPGTPNLDIVGNVNVGTYTATINSVPDLSHVVRGRIIGTLNAGTITLDTKDGILTKETVDASKNIKATTVNLNNGASLSSLTNVTVTTANLADGSKLEGRGGAVNVTTLNVKGDGNSIDSIDTTGNNDKNVSRTMKIGNIEGANGEINTLDIKYAFSQPTAKAAGVSGLTIDGAINNVSVNLVPYKTRYFDNRYDNKIAFAIDEIASMFNVADTASINKVYGSNKRTDPVTNDICWYNQKLATMGKAQINSIKVNGKATGNEFTKGSHRYFYKSGTGLYTSSVAPMITVKGYSDSAYTAPTYVGQFDDFNEATKEVDRIRVKNQKDSNNAYVKYEISNNIGGEGPTATNPDETKTPVGALTLPANVTEVWVVGSDIDPDESVTKYPTIFTTGTAVTLKTATKFEKFGVANRVYNSKTKKYNQDNGFYSISGNKLALTTSGFTTTSGAFTAPTPLIKDVTVGELTVNNGIVATSGNLNATTLTGKIGSSFIIGGNVTVTDAELAGAAISAKGTLKIPTVNVSGTCTITSESTLTLTNIEGTGNLNVNYRFSAPTNKAAGSTMLAINGTIGKNVALVLNPSIPVYNSLDKKYVYSKQSEDGREAQYLFNIFDTADKNETDSDATVNRYRNKVDPSVWYNQSLATVSKGALWPNNVTVIVKDTDHTANNPALNLYKSGQALYLSSTTPKITVKGYKLTGANGTKGDQTYEGKFVDLAQAVAEVGRVGSAKFNAENPTDNSYVEIHLAEISDNDERAKVYGSATAPIALALPANVYYLAVNGNDNHIYTTNTTLALNSQTTEIVDLTIENRTYDKKSKSYNGTGTYSINGAKKALILDNLGTYESTTNYIGSINVGDLTVRGTADKFVATGSINVAQAANLTSGTLTANMSILGGSFVQAASIIANSNIQATTYIKGTTSIKAVSAGLYAGTYIDSPSITTNSIVEAGSNINAKTELILSDFSAMVNAAGSLTAGDLIINRGSVKAGSTITPNNMVTVTNLKILDGGSLESKGAIKATNLTTSENSLLTGSNITVATLATLAGGTIKAGTSFAGDVLKTQPGQAKDGAVTLNNVAVIAAEYDADDNVTNTMPTTISAKKAATNAKTGVEGLSRFTITGTVVEGGDYVLPANEADAPILVEIRQNTEEGSAAGFTKVSSLTDGMILATAKNVSDGWFKPADTMLPSLGESAKTYKSGTYIKHGTAELEVRLKSYRKAIASDVKGNILDVNNDDIKDEKDIMPFYATEVSDFETFEAAVAEINNLNRFKRLAGNNKNSKYYEDYDIVLLKDVEITNAKGQYVALTLPTKVSRLKISAQGERELHFSGGLTLKSETILVNDVLPVSHNNKGETVPYAISLGAYRLSIWGECPNNYHVSSITGVTNNKNSRLLLDGTPTLYVDGNINVYGIDMLNAAINIKGTLTTTELNSTPGHNGRIELLSTKPMVVNGAISGNTDIKISDTADVVPGTKVATIKQAANNPIVTGWKIMGDYTGPARYNEYTPYMVGNELRVGSGHEVDLTNP